MQTYGCVSHPACMHVHLKHGGCAFEWNRSHEHEIWGRGWTGVWLRVKPKGEQTAFISCLRCVSSWWPACRRKGLCWCWPCKGSQSEQSNQVNQNIGAWLERLRHLWYGNESTFTQTPALTRSKKENKVYAVTYFGFHGFWKKKKKTTTLFLFHSKWLEPPPELSNLVVKHKQVYGSEGG